MKKIFITGCNGQLGRAINVKYANNTDVELVNTDVAELDITNVDSVVSMIRDIKPYAMLYVNRFDEILSLFGAGVTESFILVRHPGTS